LNIRIELTSLVASGTNPIAVEPTVTPCWFACDDTSFLEVKVEAKVKNRDETWADC